MLLNNWFRNSILIVICLITIQCSYAQLNKYTFESLDTLQKIDERPVVVFFHTDWCKYCLAMENTVFISDSIISVLNKDFYYVPFNAEHEESVKYRDKTFLFESNGVNTGTHQIATHYASEDGSVSYPAIVVLWKGKSIFKRNSFMDEDELLGVLNHISSL